MGKIMSLQLCLVLGINSIRNSLLKILLSSYCCVFFPTVPLGNIPVGILVCHCSEGSCNP
uniref:Uncharacterized protein n=1 Tax=Anguilla anguilla TaxID=7936 RepID=A0A0E9P902_ANGAN